MCNVMSAPVDTPTCSLQQKYCIKCSWKFSMFYLFLTPAERAAILPAKCALQWDNLQHMCIATEGSPVHQNPPLTSFRHKHLVGFIQEIYEIFTYCDIRRQ